MEKLKYDTDTQTPLRIGVIVLLAAAGLLLTLAAVMAQLGPNFGESGKTGPLYARPNQVITYTIVVVNTGDAVADSVVLSDTLPNGLKFITDTCTYNAGSVEVRCGSPDRIWEARFDPGDRITTTFAVTVTADAQMPPLQLANHAHITWPGGQVVLPFTTTVLNAIPVFTSSYKIGDPQESTLGNVVTYTIMAVNTGDSVRGVVLSDPLPAGVLPATCVYDIGGGATGQPCTSPPTLWQEDLGTGDRITTTLAVTLTRELARHPLENCACLLWNGDQEEWEGIRQELCFTTTVRTEIYLPLVLRDYAPFTNGSFEAGLSAWRVVESPLPVAIVSSVEERPSGSTPPADGSKILLLGDTGYTCGDVPLGHAAAEQTFTVPQDATALTFKYIMWSQDASIKEKYDRFEVYLNSDLKFFDGNQVKQGLSCGRWWRVPGPDNPRGGQTNGWATGEIDLSAYIGQNITLSFRNYSRFDNWYNTYTYIDDVRIETSP